MGILEILRQPWPWYVAGPLIGLTVPLLLLLGNKAFGISSNLRHACAMLPGSSRIGLFNYDWRKEAWNLVFVLGVLLGGFVGGVLLANPEPLQVAASTQRELAALGVETDGALVPRGLFSWANLLTLPGLVLMVGGGFLVGFGARYAGGCTSGHAISGLSNLQLPSLVAVIGFFIGGLISTHVLLPLILGG
ncbi:YeeE/YedE family protein [Truepera radiovictrix]|uniref:Uncharacterized protein n=1 Tax=Truepera radiovictrix (strain DSM 17093 / CIP 108686 / LMG 22925 / RQ-24) TaxID=649638 RepID=D7CU38_TRURR|nr:YeeE/YedE thiosulfate transporter family protein [Truepera radiovictrix]ADI13936.1 protein of unknown function DUF395 YeeE/YedE [Truepera radiovictrix DSM 17093]WMT57500.1 YeeE/YedE thiosulfate transporter family protein [Truepera radiovictrix]